MLTCSSLRASYITHTGSEGGCTCDKCVKACEHKPGLFLPDEIDPLAQNMGLTRQKLFDQHLAVNCLETPDGDVLVLSPKGHGTILSVWGPCVFLRDNRCNIHNIGKPFECAAARCDTAPPLEFRYDIVRVWSRAENQKMIWDLIAGKYVEPA